MFDVAQRQSGYSKDMSMYALEDYTQVEHVMARIVHTGRASSPPEAPGLFVGAGLLPARAAAGAASTSP